MKTLSKGENVNLTRENPTLKILEINLEHSAMDEELYEETEFGAILCDSENKALKEDTLIYFNNEATMNEDVTFDEETYKINLQLDAIPEKINSIDIISWINNRNKKYGQLKYLKIHIKNGENSQSLLTIDSIDDTNKDCRAIIAIKIYRYNGEWKVRAINDGWVNGIDAIVKEYGIEGE